MHRRTFLRQAGIVFLAIFLLAWTGVALPQFDPDLFRAMKARSIGPAGMSGRVTAIDVVVDNPDIIYVGTATGGVWKSTDRGITWKPIFDDQPVSSIGAVAIFQANPSIVWVGTGEGNPRNSSGVGNGIYKSLDGGETWVHLGLEKTEKIHRIVLDPTNPKVAYVAALGPTWGESQERGVYKTTDGGKTWKRILYVNERTGCADLVMDPTNPNKLFAAMWEHRRWPWFFKSGGPGSGLYVTYDGGTTWKKITSKEGLPEGELGRIGIAISRSNPNVVYAIVEAKKNVLCRSDDGGKTWRVVNREFNVAPRPFYFADIRVDPENENRVYNLHQTITVSEDGGKSLQRLIRSSVHPDHHYLWIHPEDGSFMIDGNDGGIAITYDRGKTWRFVENLPLAQYYHVTVDMAIPYNVYGGLQDNGSWRGPSEVWENGGIRNYHWVEVGFGDGFDCAIDPKDPNIGYSMSQGGNLMRFNLVTGERKAIRPPDPEGVELRFNWNAGFAIDPFDPGTIYYGSQFVHKSTDRGDTWEIISPDLTTNDTTKQKQDQSGGLTRDVTAAENYTTILTIAPSPVKKGVIWVGTDDGQVQVTTDGGKTWTNVTKNIPGLPPNTWCPHIEPSKFEPDVAYVVFDDHRRSNWTTYVYKATKFGKKWISLTKNDPTAGSSELWGFAHVIEQDPVKKELLFLGTEFGLWVSFDEGKHWMKWKHGVPTVPVRDLVVHPRDYDLVIATHGRGIFILDDIRPLRAISEELLAKPLHLFEIPPVYQHQVKQVDGYRFPADAMFRGENRPYGALITYYANPPKKPGRKGAGEPEGRGERGATGNRGKRKPKVKIEILDENGKVIRHMEGPMEKGLNRVVWNLRMDGFRMPFGQRRQRGRRGGFGPEVLPGTYTVKIKMGKEVVTGKVEVKPDPRIQFSLEDRKAKLDAILRAGRRMEVLSEAVYRIRDTKRAIDVVLERVRDQKDSTSKALVKAGKDLKKKLEKVEFMLVSPQKREGIFRDRNVSRYLFEAMRTLSSSWDRPTASEIQKLERAEKKLEEALAKFNKVYAEDVKAFKEMVRKANFTLFPEKEPLDLNWQPKKDKEK